MNRIDWDGLKGKSTDEWPRNERGNFMLEPAKPKTALEPAKPQLNGEAARAVLKQHHDLVRETQIADGYQVKGDEPKPEKLTQSEILDRIRSKTKSR